MPLTVSGSNNDAGIGKFLLTANVRHFTEWFYTIILVILKMNERKYIYKFAETKRIFFL